MKVLSERYRLLEKIGAGNMGEVYMAEDMRLHGKRWAVKKLTFSADGQSAREMELLGRLDHPQLPRIVDVCSEEQTVYLVMDYLQGQTVATLFGQQQQKLPWQRIVHWALQLCDVFQYLHEEQKPAIVYRDLKPEHLLVDAHDRIKLIDFGIARVFRDGQANDTMQWASLGFAAPEQLADCQSDARTDLYALGALLYYLLSGGSYASLSGKPFASFTADWPTGLTRVVERLLEIDPDRRYQRAYEVKQELLTFVEARSPKQTDEPSAPTAKALTKLIACRGVERTAGCTHLAMLLAHFLARRGLRVALLERANAPSFHLLQRGPLSPLSSEAVSEGVDRFSLAGVDYVPRTDSRQLVDWLFAGYDFVVIDFGSRLDEWDEREFMRAHVPLVVGFGSDWRRPTSEQWKQQTPAAAADRCQWVNMLAGGEAGRERNAQATNEWKLPASCDVRHGNEETDRVLTDMLREWLPADGERTPAPSGLLHLFISRIRGGT